MPRHRFFISVSIATVVGIAAALAPAAAQAPAGEFDREFGVSGPVKKSPGWRYRPAKDAPDAQLAHADRLRAEGKTRRARRAYRELVHQWHAAPQAVDAQRAYAELLLEAGKHRAAFDEYQYMIDHFAGDFPYEDVLRRQFQIANYLRTTRQGAFLFFPGVAAPERALPLYEQIVDNAPNWAGTPECLFYIGLIHEGDKDYELAATAYETLMLRFPASDFVVGAAFRRAKALYEIASRSPRDEQLTRDALTALIAFDRRYGRDPNAEAVRDWLVELKDRLATQYFEKAEYYDKIAKRPKSAVIAYSDFVGKFPNSEMRAVADERIATLQLEMERMKDE